MTLPILILAAPSALAGWLARGIFARDALPWAPGASFPGAEAPAGTAHPASWLPIVTLALAAAGIALAAYRYAAKGTRPGYPGRTAPAWYRALAARFWIDEAWLFLAKVVGGKAVAGPLAWMERRILNGAYDRIAGALRRSSFAQALLQSGQVQWYIAVALAGLFALAAATGTAAR